MLLRLLAPLLLAGCIASDGPVAQAERRNALYRAGLDDCVVVGALSRCDLRPADVPAGMTGRFYTRAGLRTASALSVVLGADRQSRPEEEASVLALGSGGDVLVIDAPAIPAAADRASALTARMSTAVDWAASHAEALRVDPAHITGTIKLGESVRVIKPGDPPPV